MKAKTAHVRIDITDVIAHGSIHDAIHAWAEESDDTSSGVIGPSFSTSGPGPGWSKNHDANDFAARAFNEGALHYIDADDGRLISVESAEDAEEDADGDLPDDVYRDIGGCLYRVGDWTDESVVELICPSIEDALDHPAETAEMAQAVINTHGAESDRAEWRKLVATIRDAAEALEDIDLDDLEQHP